MHDSAKWAATTIEGHVVENHVHAEAFHCLPELYGSNVVPTGAGQIQNSGTGECDNGSLTFPPFIDPRRAE